MLGPPGRTESDGAERLKITAPRPGSRLLLVCFHRRISSAVPVGHFPSAKINIGINDKQKGKKTSKALVYSAAIGRTSRPGPHYIKYTLTTYHFDKTGHILLLR